MSLRVPTKGRLATLLAAYADGGEHWERPPVAKWMEYTCLNGLGKPLPRSTFGTDKDWIVYTRCEGTRFSLAEAPRVTEAMRQTLMNAAKENPAALRYISGHEPKTDVPLQEPHVAIVPLGFAGREHADGHLLGLAVILPRALPYGTADAIYKAIVQAENPHTGEITLTFGKAGTLVLTEEQRAQPPLTLLPETWCRPSKTWASVVPIVCDRMPPRPNRYDSWVLQQLENMCGNIGLPKPVSVRTSDVSACIGAPSCKEVQPLLRRSDKAPRWHIHAVIRFAEPVCGPVILGAGRYRGYGLCKPIQETTND